MGNTPCISFRFKPEDLVLIEELMVRYGMSRTDVVRMAVRRLNEELVDADRVTKKSRKKSRVGA